MERETRRIFWIVALLVVAVVALRFAPSIRRAVAPRPIAAHVVLLPEGEMVARDGALELTAGTPFRLFAVVEAVTLTGRRVVYSEASGIEIAGVPVPAGEIETWPPSRPARVRWFTVEGFAPYLAVADPAELERFRLVENFHPEWGPGWSVPGRVDPRAVQLEPDSPLRPLAFGSQRYAIRFELLAGGQAVTPELRVASPGADETLAAAAGGATLLVAELPGPLATVSRAFGLTQVATATDLSPELAKRIGDRHARLLLFDRTRLLADHLSAAGRTPSDLGWRAIDLEADDLDWDEEVGPGDLLQGGGRIVVLFRDEGEAGRLDPADLCFDFERGAKIRRIDEVFRERGGFELEWASLGRPSRPGGG